jgi:hypothetical protein
MSLDYDVIEVGVGYRRWIAGYLRVGLEPRQQRDGERSGGRGDWGNERRREVYVMMRGGGHVVLGVCSPFEKS